MADAKVEPWLRGTLTEYDSVRRQVLHALELAAEDVERWCAPLRAEEMDVRPFGIASVGYHLRHMARSLDRLLTYAEGRQLDERQMVLLGSELTGTAEVMDEFRAGIVEARRRVIGLGPGTFEEAREVGRGRLPSTVGGLLVHVAEHTQRHVGQAVSTAQVVVGLRVEREKEIVTG